MIEPGTAQTGQELVEDVGYGSYRRYKKVKVSHITPSGLIVLMDGRRFRPNGSSQKSAAHFTELKIPTPETQAFAEREEHLAYISLCQWKKLDNETLKEVVALLKSRTEKKGN